VKQEEFVGIENGVGEGLRHVESAWAYASKNALENSESYFSRSLACVKYWWRTSTIKEKALFR
jgi:hypothetical protein